MVEKRVTGRDVARAAGVTTATVSNVLNGKRNVGEATRERVLAAVRKLGYLPDQNARSLRQRNGHAIGVVVGKSLSNSRYGRTVEGMLQEASDRGYRLSLCRNRIMPNGMRDYLAAYYQCNIDGVIFMSHDTEGPDSESLQTVIDGNIPFVALDCQTPSTKYSTVDFDYRGGAADATCNALSYGHKRLLYIRPSVNNAQETLREEGVRQACAEANATENLIVIDVDVQIQLDDEFADTRLEMSEDPTHSYAFYLDTTFRKLLSGRIRPGDAIVCSWPGWSAIIRSAFPLPNVMFTDLASESLSMSGTDAFCVMPNAQAGKVCVDTLVSLIEGSAPQSHLLPIRCIDVHRKQIVNERPTVES